MLPTFLAINFIENKAYICKETFVPIADVAILLKEKLFLNPASWWVRIIRANPENGQLFFEILEYRNVFTPFNKQQLQAAQELSCLHQWSIKNLDTSCVLWNIRGKVPGEKRRSPKMEALFFTDESVRNDSTERVANSEEFTLAETQGFVQYEMDDISGLPVVVHQSTFQIPLKALQFSSGAVVCKRKLFPLDTLQEIRILNDEIRPEFDAIKNYFSKVLGKKYVDITTIMTLQNGEVIRLEALSPEVSSINSTMIESLKFELVKAGFKKKLAIDIDQSLFTADEFFDRLGMEKSGFNAFFADDADWMNSILQIRQTKHYRNLRYLSDRHAHHILKLRFILQPFSFIFLLEGERYYHIIWETLDTAEATWHWPVLKDQKLLRNALSRIEEIINVVKVQGKTAYIGNADESFRRIIHDYSDLNDGFIRWKGELESYLM